MGKDLFLFNRIQLHANLLSLDESLNQSMQRCRQLNLPKIHEGIHNIFDLFLLLIGNFDFLLQEFDEVIFFEWGSFFDSSRLPHLLFLLLVILPLGLFAGLREAAGRGSTRGAALLGFGEGGCTTHGHLIGVESKPTLIHLRHMHRHSALIMLNNLEPQVPLRKIVQKFEEMVFLNVIGE